MIGDSFPFNRRTVLKTVGATVLGGSVIGGVSRASHTISVPGDEPTIEDAIAAADPGATIEVASGTYTENPLNINNLDDLTLRGAGSDQVTVIRSGGSGNRGLTVDNSDDVTLKGFTLRDTDPSVFGLKLQFSDNLHVEDVHAVDNGRTGIDLNTTDNPTLINVEARNNDGAGIALRNLTGATVDEAETSGNAWGGLALWAPPGEKVTDTEITNSSFLNEPSAGIFAQYPGTYSNVNITHNDIENSGVGVAIDDQFGLVADSDEISVRLNNITGNDTGIDNTGGAEELPATCNYWGHPTGPDHEDNPKENPKGDSIEGEVDFIPWNTRRIGRGKNPENSCVGGKENDRGKGNGP